MFLGNRFTLYSPWPPDRCAAELRQAIVNDWSWEGLAASKQVAGSVSAKSLRLRKRKYLLHNSFQTYLRASLVQEGPGTTISGRCGMHPLVMAFMIFWLCVAGFGSLFMIGAHLHGFRDWIENPQLLLPLAMPIGGIAVIALGQLLAYGEDIFLIDFLAKSLNARRTDGGREN